MSKGFIKLNREAEELLEQDPNAFLLLTQIALRCKWKKTRFDDGKTQVGEALIGDYENCGLSEKAYRLAKQRLSDRKFAAFKGTSKGTIAKLLDNSVYDLNLEDEVYQKGEQKDRLRADKGRTEGGQGATKEEGKKGRIEEDNSLHSLSPPPTSSIEKNGGGGKRKAAFKYQGPISSTAIAAQQRLLKFNLAVSVDNLQKWLDIYGLEALKIELEGTIDQHKRQKIGDPAKYLGKRLYNNHEQKGKIYDISSAAL